MNVKGREGPVVVKAQSQYAEGSKHDQDGIQRTQGRRSSLVQRTMHMCVYVRADPMGGGEDHGH